MIHITRHASERWVERVNPHLDVESAHDAIMAHEKILRLAIDFGACAVKLGCGVKLVLCGNSVVTVIRK